MSKTKPLIGISTGDPNGIGIEVILKCYQDKRMFHFGIPIVFSNYDLLKTQINHLNLNVELKKIDEIEKAKPNKLNILEVSNSNFDLSFGKINSQGGDFSRKSLTEATRSLKDNKINILVTAPINKKNIINNDFDFMGHTDFLNKYFDGDALMFMVSEDLKDALLTEHLSLIHI